MIFTLYLSIDVGHFLFLFRNTSLLTVTLYIQVRGYKIILFEKEKEIP